MSFWKMAWNMKAITIDMLRQAVITEENKFGEITIDEFKQICGKEFVSQ